MSESQDTGESAARLYGPPLAETLYFTIEEAWEVTDGDEVVEHTVHPPRYHLPAAVTVGEWLAEWAAENGELDEYGSDDIANACLNRVALAAIEACLETIGTQVTYRMADKEVATHRRPPLSGRCPVCCSLDGHVANCTWPER